MFDISPLQIVIVLGIALLVFGPKRLPEMGRSIGRGIRDFKDGLTNDEQPPGRVPAEPGAAAISGPPADAEPSLEEIVKEKRPPSRSGTTPGIRSARGPRPRRRGMARSTRIGSRRSRARTRCTTR